MSNDSITNLIFNSLEIDHECVGTNSRLTDEHHMSDPNLKWIKTIIQARDRSQNKIKVNIKELNNIQKKLLKYLQHLKIIKDFIYLVDKDKYGNERNICQEMKLS